MALATVGWPAAAHAQTCAERLAGTEWRPPSVVSSTEKLDFDDLLARLRQKRVVMIGEVHDRYEHHLNQLALICGLHQRYPDLAIGLEFFQQPFQDPLDAYVERRIDVRDMLAQTEYYNRWRFDYRLYAPILEFAREQGIPVVALNISQEISSKVAREGISALSDAERAQLPAQLDHNNLPGYRQRLRAVFEQHPEIQHVSFDNFVEAQLVWDETMAERAARFMKAHPDRFLVVLAGDGHIIRSGIPARFARLSGVAPVTVLQGQSKEIAPEDGDYLLLSEPIELPPSGKLGVMLETRDDRVVVSDFSEYSAAKDAGILKQDQIVKLDGEFIASFADLKLTLMDKRPGDSVSVTVERAGSGQMTREASYRLILR